MRKLSLTLMNLRPKKRPVLNLPIWLEKDGDNMSWISEVLGGVMMFGMVYVFAVIMLSL